MNNSNNSIRIDTPSIQAIRPRRNRQNQNIREMFEEMVMTKSNLIAPLFLIDGENACEGINSMPGQYRFGLNSLLREIEELMNLGIRTVSLFPAFKDSLKDSKGSIALNRNNFYLQYIRKVKNIFPEITIMTDIALDPYSSDGHDGLVDKNTLEVLNDETLPILVELALLQADAGSDILGPSDMMDGRIGALRNNLEKNDFKNTLIMSYTAKYASNLYAPFRDALDSAPKQGDKKSYQMNFKNRKEALRELVLDESEGADILMVKPGIFYLDIISDFKANSTLPIAAYNVSGEYAMIKAAANNGWIDDKKVMMEMLYSFKRAGADIILTYFAKEACRYPEMWN